MEIFGRYQRSEQALVLALREMAVNGISTRKVTAITEELCRATFSKSTVSQLCLGLDLREKSGSNQRTPGYPHSSLVSGVLPDLFWARYLKSVRTRGDDCQEIVVLSLFE